MPTTTTTTKPVNEIINTGTFVLRAKYLGPTNSKGARIKVTRLDNAKESITVPFDYALEREERYNQAVALWTDKYGYLKAAGKGYRWLDSSWKFVCGYAGPDDGYLYTATCFIKKSYEKTGGDQ